MMVETHLGPNMEVHQTHLKEVTGSIWAGVGLHKGVTSRSCQGHLKVTAKSNQPKSVKILSFCCYCFISVHLKCL